jgi:hypothetical protein
VLYFQPPAEKTGRLRLIPQSPTNQDALIEIEEGNLEIVGGALAVANSTNILPYLLKVRRGDLRLSGCRLEGPSSQAASSYRSLIHFEGTGEEDRARACTLEDCILLSGRNCLEIAATGARVRLQNCVAVSGNDTFVLQPGNNLVARLNAELDIEQSTIAARRAVIHLRDAGNFTSPIEPIAVKAMSSLFLAPFDGPSPRSAFFLFEKDALPHGLMVWQGTGNGYDAQIKCCATSGSSATWPRLWGPFAERESYPDLSPAGSLDLEHPQLDRLALSQAVRNKIMGTIPGADLVKLGITKTP